MKQPEYMPDSEPQLSKDNPVKYHPIVGVSFFKPDDGILYYYDQPLMFIARIEQLLVIITLLDEEYEGPPENAKGWKQYIAFPITKQEYRDVWNSKIPVRDPWDNAKSNWFIHEDWKRTTETTWETEYKLYKDVPVKESWKPHKGIYLSVNGKKED